MEAGQAVIGGADPLTTYWGHIYPGGYDLLVPTIARAVKAGFHVHLLQPDSSTPACTLTDRLASKEHDCWHPIAPMENASRVRPFVRACVERAEERYGAPLNVGIELLPSGYFLAIPEEGDHPTLYSSDPDLFASWWLRPIPEGAHMPDLAHLERVILPVPPSVYGGTVVRCWSTDERA